MSESFTAVVIEDDAGKARTTFKQLRIADLPDHDVLVEVEFSTLNYKDGLVLRGNRGKVARKLPIVAGIDLAGTVVESRSPAWSAGDKVVVNGFGLSETQYGGYARYARVKSEWLVRLPSAFSTEQAMAIGTAGYTSALCVDALVDFGLTQDAGEVLVTGAAGGVGSVAVALLAAAGFDVVASTGRPETHDYLKALGARSFVDRASLQEKGAPLQRERWAGAVDVVGGATLANVLAQTKYGRAVAACGLTASADLPATVLPHILRSVALLGVDSVMAPIAKREKADADIPPAELACIRSLGTGASPLDPAVQRAFEERYGIPILLSYGATEFGGRVSAMTAQLHAEWGKKKLGSVGRPVPGANIRVVDAETGAVVPAGHEGLLEVVSPHMGPSWIRTTDIGVIDEDGFVFHRGRANGAITRGGFKILPETIERALLLHAVISAVAVVGVADRRLGQTPAAAIALKRGAAEPSIGELEAHLREHVLATHVPVQWRFVEALPQTPSLKVDRAGVRALFEGQS